jgi:hypothetical protein
LASKKKGRNEDEHLQCDFNESQRDFLTESKANMINIKIDELTLNWDQIGKWRKKGSKQDIFMTVTYLF